MVNAARDAAKYWCEGVCLSIGKQRWRSISGNNQLLMRPRRRATRDHAKRKNWYAGVDLRHRVIAVETTT